MLQHTPPSVVVSSYEAAHQKRPRGGSLSGRLRTAADLEERGIIDPRDKGTIKDMIIAGDERLQTALDKYEGGDSSELEVLVQHGMLNKRGSTDLIEDLDINGLYVAHGNDPLRISKLDLEAAEAISGPWPSTNPKRPDLSLDDLPFDAFDDQSSYGSNNSLSGGLGIGPSSLGRTPPDPFTGSFEESMSHLRNSPPRASLKSSHKPHPGAIDIPGFSSARDSALSGIADGGIGHDRRASHSRYPDYSTHGHQTHAGADTGDRKHYIGAYSPDARRKRIQRFLEKRKRRVWTKKVKYDVRKNFADSRMRVKGRFVKKEDEELLRELMSIT